MLPTFEFAVNLIMHIVSNTQYKYIYIYMVDEINWISRKFWKINKQFINQQTNRQFKVKNITVDSLTDSLAPDLFSQRWHFTFNRVIHWNFGLFWHIGQFMNIGYFLVHGPVFWPICLNRGHTIIHVVIQ